MDFANERYVRLYVRDTVTWKRLGWDGQNALTQLLRKADRSGVIDLGGIEPWEALVVLCGAPEDAARRGVARVIELECVVHDGDRLVFPRYIEANECSQSGAQRVREHRARERERRAELKRNVTVYGNETLQNVTAGNEVKRSVTECNSVPCRTVPYSEESALQPVTNRYADDGADLGMGIRVGFSQRLEKAAKAIPNQRALGALVRDLTPWIRETAALRKLSEADLCERVLDGFFASEKARKESFPPAFLAHNPLEYLDAKPPLRAARVPDGIPPIRNFGPKKEAI